MWLGSADDCAANVAANFKFADPTDCKSVATISWAAPPVIDEMSPS